MASTLSHRLFTTPEFAQFCDRMQIEAADELRTLRETLDMVIEDEEAYRTSSMDQCNMDTTSSAGPSGHGLPHRHPNNISAHSAMRPPATLLRGQSNSLMLIGSPSDRTFSPTISPSPPKQDTRALGSHPMSLMESPSSADDNMMRTPVIKSQQRMSHSMPTQPLDIPSDNYFGSVIGGGDSSSGNAISSGVDAKALNNTAMLPLIKRRRPEQANASLPPPSHMVPGPEGGFYPGGPTKPQCHVSGHRPQRLPRSPPSTALRSPRLGGPRAVSITLPSLSQIAQNQQQFLPVTNPQVSPMLVSSPNLGRGSSYQRTVASGFAGLQRQDTDVYMSSGNMRRPSGTITEGGAGGGGGYGIGAGRDDFSHNDIEQISLLREENSLLRQRLQKLEMSVIHKHAEMQTWMSRIEKAVARNDDGDQQQQQ
ncbi:hypothetical protein BX661DRAFT_168224 [Kickxella alabastrina]|uniref:uncharacterized protein n=1 Tax=Kickxella alabastrina TaxID=61397 RepID=UPI00221F6E60|nr:uncharacterized protein BX661DRAFT_168224 [Kickxella alabastrina]KAI7835051.1 hypothetical protein BX661DRAFT_168224 [Kickxella alabastrina]